MLKQVQPRLLAAFLLVLLVLALWLAAEWLLMPNRGLDLRDESLYLLEADVQSPTASYVFPFGWHTGPFFNLLGGDVSAFRTAGAVILGLVGIWVGTGAARLITSAWGFPDLFITIASGVTGLAASWMFYFTLLRSPGYNWVTLVGMGIAVGAALRQWARHISDRPKPSPWANRILFAIIGFGAVYSLSAKPTTPIFIGIAYGCVAATIVGPKRAIQALAWIVTAAVIWIPVLVIIRWWHWSFVSVFLEAVQRPLVTEQQSPPQALLRYVSIPLLAYRDFRGVAALPVLVASIAYLAIASNVIRRWRYTSLLLVPYTIVLAITPYFAASNLQVWQQGWERGNLTVALLMVVAATFLLAIGRWETPQKVTTIQLTVAVFSLVGLAGAFGFSSTNTPYPLMKFASLLLAAAALVSLSRLPRALHRRLIAALLALAVSATTTHLLLQSQVAPYSSASLEIQTEPVVVGRNASVIFVDEEKAEVLNTMRSAVQKAGGESIRVIAIGPGSPGVAFASGATVPDSILLSWFDLPGDVPLAKANLSRVASAEWCDAWLLTKAYQDQTDEIASIYAEFTGRNWPGGYVLQEEVDGFKLWSPRLTCGQLAVSTD